MTEANDDILDLDNLKDDAVDNNDTPLDKQEPDSTKKKKRQYRKSNKNAKGAADALNSLEKPKMSREERKNLQLLQLFDKLEQVHSPICIISKPFYSRKKRERRT